MIMETKDRIEKAVELFKSGYNCSQSVVGAFADMYGFTEEQAFRMSASFGAVSYTHLTLPTKLEV